MVMVKGFLGCGSAVATMITVVVVVVFVVVADIACIWLFFS